MKTIFQAFLLSALMASPGLAKTVKVDFFIEAPADTNPHATLFLAGNQKGLGDWKADGVKLHRLSSGQYHVQVSLPESSEIDFKVTRGSWQSVEKGSLGEDIPNHSGIAKAGIPIKAKVVRWEPGKLPSTLTGNFRFHKAFASKLLDNQRDITVYLPPDYEKNLENRYPVLYLHDGQNVFDRATAFLNSEWQADETAQRLILDGRIAPLIIVGVNYVDRISEYTPVPEVKMGGGKGERYARFLVEELKPFIDKTYRTIPDREHTAVSGSSLGGLISLYICERYPEVFAMCGAVSPSIWWSDQWILNKMKGLNRAKPIRYWIDMGTKEADGSESNQESTKDTRALVQILDDQHLLPGKDYYYQEVDGAKHNEQAWAKRFDKILLYFFGK